jgi:signal transduction histidine kinase
MGMLFRSITRRLMILFFLVGVSCLSIVGVYSYKKSKEAILKRTLDQLTSIRVIKKRQIQSFFVERFDDLRHHANNQSLLSSIATVRSKTPEMIIPPLKTEDTIAFSDAHDQSPGKLFFLTGDQMELLEVYSISDEVRPFSPKGEELNAMRLLYAKSITSHDMQAVDFIRRFENDTAPVGFLGLRCADEDSNIIGIIAYQIPIADINSIMLEDNEENGLGTSGEIYLVGSDMLMRSSSRFIPNSVLRIRVETPGASDALNNRLGTALIKDYRGIKVLSSYDAANIPGFSWGIIAEIDYREAMVPINSIRNDILFISLLICVFLFSIAHLISQTISKPIIRLKKAAESIGEGNLGLVLDKQSNDEIGALTDSFNQMSKQLREERQQRMSALYDGQELERQRISMELHDGISQSLFAMKLQLESSNKIGAESHRDLIEETKTHFAKTIEEIRQISNNLAPSILRDSTLESGLRHLCASSRKTSCSKIEFSSFGDYEPENQKIKTYLYRIAQEALSNAIKHAKANSIQIQIMGNKDSIILTIEDNGLGFEPTHLQAESGNGLYNMKERATILGGKIIIDSELGKGTTLRVIIPKHVNE